MRHQFAIDFDLLVLAPHHVGSHSVVGLAYWDIVCIIQDVLVRGVQANCLQLGGVLAPTLRVC